MRIPTVLIVTAMLTACADVSTAAPGAEALVTGDRSVVATDGARSLLRGPPSTPMPQTDERPSFEMELVGPSGAIAAPGRVWVGVIVADGAVWVLADGTLQHSDGTVLDRNALPELAVSADRNLLAYPRAQVEGGGVRIVDLRTRQRRLVTADLALADRPLFLPDGRLVVIGAETSGIPGVRLVDPAGIAPSVAVTNAGLRTGRPFGPTFVPPPAYHASMHVVGGTLVYDDGHREQRVALPGAV